MDRPLLDTVELTMIDINTVEDVRINHVELLEKGHNTSIKMSQLIHVLGGMDYVLSNCLSKDNP